MQVAVLWSVIAALVLAGAAALLRLWQLLRAAREREGQLDRQLAHACGFALAGPLGSSGLQELAQALDALGERTAAAQSLCAQGRLDALQEALPELGERTAQARENVHALLALLQPRDRSRETFDANDMAAEAVHLITPEAKRRGMELVVLPCPGSALVAGERSELHLVLLQLVANALDAMQDTPAAFRRVLVATHASPGGVELQVSDRGHGFGARRPDTLFSPYYTTRQGHMGLGLAVARRVVEAHGGRIEARRRAGGGAVFTVTLPRAAAAPLAPAPARPPSLNPSCVVQP
ncbi:hypothetical protein H8N03_12820 [Ramlibacter sp. USB13]|uniref:histidine kinase n=1 Tax=Ramlibacter cellulosilyticus TaxID=2764187 RepID=A0A923MRW2_9BURK|nr:ATP-binding protein [Ramlibacter cellulosilyticus]MBC5783831.1 hypothetical protein [Ramlibacter cellulosilyticus]